MFTRKYSEATHALIINTVTVQYDIPLQKCKQMSSQDILKIDQKSEPICFRVHHSLKIFITRVFKAR